MMTVFVFCFLLTLQVDCFHFVMVAIDAFISDAALFFIFGSTIAAFIYKQTKTTINLQPRHVFFGCLLTMHLSVCFTMAKCKNTQVQ